jgi:cytochrome c oxidase subunit II
MRLNRIVISVLVIYLVLAATAMAQDGVGEACGACVPATHEIQMTAKKYEFTPNVITVKKGEPVKLVITATDRDHGFKLDAFKINQRLKKGVPTTVEFTADKVGEFPFKCSVICGIGHHRMKGKVIVEE